MTCSLKVGHLFDSINYASINCSRVIYRVVVSIHCSICAVNHLAADLTVHELFVIEDKDKK